MFAAPRRGCDHLVDGFSPACRITCDQGGQPIFVDELTGCAQRTGHPGLSPVIAGLTAPLRVAVSGRDGVGRGTVAAALEGRGVCLSDPGEPTELTVRVIAETLKPEDRTALAAGPTPALTVLNKADLAGHGPGGPWAVAHRRAERCRALTGVPTVPMIALLAHVDLDDELAAALRILPAEPAELCSVDAFVAAPHRVPAPVRARLLSELDRFGIAHAVLAVGRGADRSAVSALLRRLSGVEEVLAALQAAAAPVRYRRVRRALAQVRALAVASPGSGLAEFLTCDATVVAVMAAAAEVVRAAGLAVGPGAGAEAQLRGALRWRRYSRGPVDELHRSCGADIARGALRLYSSGGQSWDGQSSGRRA